jgi:Calpain family cysteine protease
MSIFVVALTAAAQMPVATNAPSSPLRTPHKEFHEVVEANFSFWDTNADDVLTLDEVDAAVFNPRFREDAAAALAAIKIALHPSDTPPPRMTRTFLSSVRSTLSPIAQTNAPAAGKLAGPAGPEESRKTDAPERKLLRLYRSRLIRLESISREIFPQGPPDLHHCHQGSFGDCWFLSTLGAIIHRNPSAVQGMLDPHKDGSATVTFPHSLRVRVSALTDTEIAISDHADGNGLWLPIIEKAFFIAYESINHEKHNADNDVYDEIHGAPPGRAMNVLVGHGAFTIRVLQSRESDVEMKLRQAIILARNQHRVAVGFTPDPKKNPRLQLPPGLPGKHAYAILGYNPDAKTVHLWNPWGNRFKPKGSDGFEHGYTTTDGEFQMPLSDLLRCFAGVTFEALPRESTRQ